MDLLLYLLVGVASGILSGLFGIGGGLIIVPILIYSFTLQGFDIEVLTHLAVGTSLATIVFTSINSIWAHHQKGAVHWPYVGWMTIGIVIGSGLGALTASLIAGPNLQKVIGVFAILMSAQMFFSKQSKVNAQVTKPIPPVGLGAAGGVIGWASSIFGIGGGSLTVPFLSWRGMPMKEAVATSAACGFPIAVSGAISFIWVGLHVTGLPKWSAGYIYLPALLGIASTSLFFARFGARLAHRLDAKLLKRLFACLLLLVGLQFLL